MLIKLDYFPTYGWKQKKSNQHLLLIAEILDQLLGIESPTTRFDTSQMVIPEFQPSRVWDDQPAGRYEFFQTDWGATHREVHQNREARKDPHILRGSFWGPNKPTTI